jgi:hypothetical protein
MADSRFGKFVGLELNSSDDIIVNGMVVGVRLNPGAMLTVNGIASGAISLAEETSLRVNGSFTPGHVKNDGII